MAANPKTARTILLAVLESALQRPEVQARVVTTTLRCLEACADSADALTTCVSAGAEILKARAKVAPKLNELHMRRDLAHVTLAAESAERELARSRKPKSRRRGGKAKTKVNGALLRKRELDLGALRTEKEWEDEFLSAEEQN